MSDEKKDSSKLRNDDNKYEIPESIVLPDSILQISDKESFSSYSTIDASGSINFDFSAGDDIGIMNPAAEAHNQQVNAHSISSDLQSIIINEIGSKPNSIPLIGKLSVKNQYAVGFGMLIASLTIAGSMAASGFLKSSDYKSRAENATSLQMLSQRLLSAAQTSLFGSEAGSETLKESYRLTQNQLNILRGNDSDSNSIDVIKKEVGEGVMKNAEEIINLIPQLKDIKKKSDQLSKTTNALAEGSEQLLNHFQTTGAPESHIAAAVHIRVLTGKVILNGERLLKSHINDIDPLTAFLSDIKSISDTMNSFAEGDPTIDMPPVYGRAVFEILDELDPVIAELNEVKSYIEKSSPSIIQARKNLQNLEFHAENTLTHSQKLNAEMSAISEDSLGTVYLSVIFLASALASLVLLGIVNNRATRIESWETAFKSKRNEKDIIKFMEEIMPLEAGDLRVRFNQNMEGMEGLTGGIRNSVNEAAIALHNAMDTVKITASDVSEVVSQSVESTNEMKTSNERQASEISDVKARVEILASAITEVTSKTLDAARATEGAKNASDEGAKVVAQTNAKMSIIRANMQDVLKSVKHLGETSHEIVDIVNTIEQITDRTQVLAVNASLEAAKAGAAGSGFQIIAGEVNRLAEQSAEALKTITALVQRVQGETGVTIRVVEESTNNVVEGARLSEVANKQLEDISSLASNLANIMDEIREQSENQDLNAKVVLSSMARLGKLSKEFQSQVSNVVGSVKKIDASMGNLKETVANFKTGSPDLDRDGI